MQIPFTLILAILFSIPALAAPVPTGSGLVNASSAIEARTADKAKFPVLKAKALAAKKAKAKVTAPQRRGPSSSSSTSTKDSLNQ
ncbi:hypothetical protein B0H11DRAFT_2213714 [Mycena galericulata]|nr:hypothetical protein B0H11DRAFT_2213714 [Mycena galericulata]